MSSSNSTLPFITQSQSSKEITANNLHAAASPAMFFARNQSTSSGLTWGYSEAQLLVNGALTVVAGGTLGLLANTTNYIEATPAGVVSRNSSGFTAGRIPLYEAVTNATSVTSYTDRRTLALAVTATGLLAKAMTDANTTLTAAEARNEILQFTGTLTAARNIVVPLTARQWTVFNNTTGGFGLQFIGASGTGVTVAATKRAIIYSDGTNVVRVTADA
jgi:hypothetical protein